MVCSHYNVVIRDKGGNEIARAIAYTFDEANWRLVEFREMLKNAWSFTIEYTEEGLNE